VGDWRNIAIALIGLECGHEDRQGSPRLVSKEPCRRLDRFARGNRFYIPFSQTPRSNAWKAALDLELLCRRRNWGVRNCSRRKACSRLVQAIGLAHRSVVIEPHSFHHILPVTAVTDLHPNRCNNSSTPEHREVRLSPETDASLVSNQAPAL